MHHRRHRVVVLVVAAVAVLAIALPSFAEDAAALFKTKCAPCHGADGTGNTPMGQKLGIRNLHSPDVQKQTDAQLTTIITKGKNKMPPFEGKLTADQVKALVAFIRTLK